MKKTLIGHTGFVGSALKRQTHFDSFYNSSNIHEIERKTFDLIICAAPSALKWLANKEPETDLKGIESFLAHLATISAKIFILISTVDVYNSPIDVDEDTFIFPETLHPYGKHRYFIENNIRKLFDNYLIIRLPGLFGTGLKKNFIYDLMNPAPRFIPEAQLNSLIQRMEHQQVQSVRTCYKLLPNGMYALQESIDANRQNEVEKALSVAGFTSLSFTHYKSVFQFYNLNSLWGDIQIALENGLSLLNFATEPISAQAIAKHCFGIDFHNRTSAPPVIYDMRTKHAKLYSGSHGYMYDCKSIFAQITDFRNNMEVRH